MEQVPLGGVGGYFILSLEPYEIQISAPPQPEH